jgi:hypothetical protein
MIGKGSELWGDGEDSAGPAEYFISRDPACFTVLLDLLRTGGHDVPPGIPEAALYYGLLDRVRAARLGKFKATARTLPHLSPGVCWGRHRHPGRPQRRVLRRARQHGALVQLGAGGAPVNDAAYRDATTLLVAARERPDQRHDGGVAASPRSRARRATASAWPATAGPSPSPPARWPSAGVQHLREMQGQHYGVGVWDWNTGEQGDFFYELHAGRRQQAPVARRHQHAHGGHHVPADRLHPFMSLLDFRDKSVVWSWSNAIMPTSLEDKHTVHTVPS